jgi:hypothetical protein
MHRIVRCTFALLFATLVALAAASAQAQTVQAIPPALTPEAVLEARAQTNRAGTYFFSIRAAGAGPLRQSGAQTPDAAGVVGARLLIGDLGPGSYNLVLSEGAATGGTVASTPLTITPPLSVKAIPDPARAGDPLVAEVSGLRGGTVQVLLDGAPVAAVPAEAATMAVPFTLPATAAPGTSRMLEARNLDGEQLIGVGRGSVRVASVAFTGPARLVNLAGLASVLEVNRPFDITGRVELRRGSPQGLRARLVARLPGGRTLMLDDGRGVVAANGDFRIRGRPPGPFNGGPALLGLLGTGQGDVAIVLVDPEVGDGRRGSTFTFPQGPRNFSDPGAPPAEIGLNVRVRDPNGQPVPDVVVTLFGEGGAGLVVEDATPGAKGGPGGTTSTPALIRPGTQYGQVMQQVASGIYDQLLFDCPISLYRNKTDVGGNVQVRLSPFALLLAQTVSLNADIVDGSPDHDANVPIATSLRLRLSPLGAGANGFTFAADPRIAQAAETYLTYDHPGRRWCFESAGLGGCTQFLAGGTIPTLTYTVRAYTGQTVLPITPVLPGLAKQGVETLVDRYGPITTFPGSAFDDAQGINIAGGMPIGFTFDQLLFGILQDARLTHRRPDGSVVEYPLSSSNAQACANVDETEYRAIVPTAHRLAWTGTASSQKHRFDISVRSGSREGGYSFLLDAQPPPRWWRDRPADAVRRVIESWSPAKATLRVDLEPDPVAVSADLSDIDMGTLANRNESTETWRGSQAGSGEASFSRKADNRSEAANQQGSPAGATSSGIQNTVTIGPTTIIDTGWVPLFRAAWGIPPIAAATFGIDAFFLATVLVEMQNSLSLDGGLSSSLTVTPQVEAAIKAFLNVSAILGFVDLTASFTPSFALAIPVQVSNGQSVDTDECFRFRMDAAYEVSVGICDFCVSASDEVNLFTKRVPSGCTIPATAAADAGKQRAPKLGDLGIRRLSPPSVAFDALGAGGLVRVGSNGAIEVRPWSAGGFGAAQSLSGQAVGASSVQHAYFASGRGVMVHERSSLSSAAFLAATLQQAAASRHMVFRVFQNGAWGAEQALTAPGSGGEGQVALAACPAGRPGCPAAGEVLAAWIRNPGADPFGYRYEVWHAFYRNGAWTAPARVADPGAGADMHPRVAYVGGTPVVTFTRSTARSIDAQATRRLMARLLPSGSAFEVPDSSGVQWQSITTDGAGRLVIAFTRLPAGAAGISNQALLWAARGTCSGTSCSFDVRQQRDALGRGIRAEAPAAQRLGDGSVRVAYTGLGYAPNAQGVRVAPGDTVGLITGLGELAQLTPRFDLVGVLPQALTGDGRLYKNVALAQHPVSQTLVVLADQSLVAPVAPDLVRKAVPFEPSRPALKGLPVGDSTVQFAVPDAPDFAIDELLPQFDRVGPDATLQLDVAIRNSGRPWAPDGRTSLRLDAAWDGPPGAGAVAGSASVASIPDDGAALVRITLRAPADAQVDQPRSLHVRINADGALAEADAGNNDASTVVGRLPAPQALAVEERRLDRLVLLSWDAPQDDRIVGYRIWRAPAADLRAGPQWFPVGSTFSTSFVDLTGDAGQDDAYRVTAFSAGGIESSPSGIAVATRDVTPPETVFASSFEGPADVREVVPAGD